MTNFENILECVDKVRLAVEAGDRELADKVGQELCVVYERDFQIVRDKDYTPEVAHVQFDALEALLEVHILRGDPIDIAIRNGQLMKHFKEVREHVTWWSDEDWMPIGKLVAKGYMAVNEYYHKETLRRMPKAPERTPECRCLLCRRNRSDKTGSHLVPHLLIGDVFSYDGSTSREKVVVESADLTAGLKDRYFGHEVYDDTVRNLLGRSFTDEEIDEEIAKKNSLTMDYVFCHDCEARFSVIESWYADILNERQADYPPQVPYLFWLSVAWRMSAGGVGFKMLEEHEDKLRKILDKCLALKREDVVLKQSKLGYCAYLLDNATDTRDETLGILAVHTPTKPYMALIGKRLFRFFTSRTAAVSFCRKHGGEENKLNFGDKKEQVGDLKFIDFWQAKRRILDRNWEDERNIWNMGQPCNRTLYRFEQIDGEFQNQMPNWMNTANDHLMAQPRAVRNIERWMKKHPESRSLKAMSEGTGYSEDELTVILHYWNGQLTKLMAKQEQTQKMKPFLEHMLENL